MSMPKTLRMRWATVLLVFVLGVFVARLPATLAAVRSRLAPPPPASAASKDAKPQPSDEEVLTSIADVYALIKGGFVDAPDNKKLEHGAIAGMLEALDDPYAEYISEEDEGDFEKQMTGQFVGIGCQVEMKEGWLTVVSPLEDSPAYAAGIMAGDKITKIEDKTTLGLTVEACIKLLTGEPKTPVNILVQRAGTEIPFTLIREKIVSKSVRGFRRQTDGTGHWAFVIDPEKRIAYVRLSQFTPTTARELFEALIEARKEVGGRSLGGLIMDLRSNPGGYMESALSIADMFLDEGVIMSVKGRDGAGEQIFRSRSGNEVIPLTSPIAVLVNGGSASASEIVSGALSDRGRGIVIGQRSFGKGLVQQVHPLPHDPEAHVKFTTQRYYLPSGRSIQRKDDQPDWGVDPAPGFYVPMTENEMIAWILNRRDRDILKKDEPEVPLDGGDGSKELSKWTNPEWIEKEGKDKQLAAAVKAMELRLANPEGEWVKVNTEENEHGRIAETELLALERTRQRMTREFARLEKRIETLEEQTAKAGKKDEPKDLWSDELDLTDGRIDVRDKDGKLIAHLKITGRDVERWLENADVKKEEAEAGGAGAGGAEAKPETKPAAMADPKEQK